MYAVNAVYDGTRILTDEPISVKGRYEVIVTFTKPLTNDDQDDILNYFGMWNNDDLNSALSVVNEREKFSLGRNDIS
ncbi:MAG: hypothetical protein LBC75_10670 [Fibromonadaceae bacterium]|nr:hypothetical protein [Fibromonadaceae bacterium]